MNHKAYGICLGASTVSAVELCRNDHGQPEAPGALPAPAALRVSRVIRVPHEGNPRSAFRQVIDDLNCGDAPILVTGRKFRTFVQLPSISEPEALEQALPLVANGDGKLFAVVSAGGETFMVYHLDANHRITGISTGNKCASGTGEFFLQQIRRMGLKMEDAVDLAGRGTPYRVSGRCSVFCKSDCTHALNKGEPITNVTAGLCEMIAAKIVELLATVPDGHVLLTGGVALNPVVTGYLRKKIASLVIPPEAAYVEALGAAVAAFAKGTPRPGELFSPGHSSFTTLPPLRDAESMVTFNEMQYGKARTGDRCIVGLDVGSTTTKAVILREEDEAILCSEYLRTNGNPVEASRQCFASIQRQVEGTKLRIVGIGVTGSGRQIAGLYSLTTGVINEIIAHAAAAVHFDPRVDTIFEIGGQDAKYTYLTNSVASDYAMNEACSAGTGSFLEESAFESLGVKTTDIAPLALNGMRPPNFNDQCSAFISSDIKNATHEGISRDDILAGLVYSICFNYVNRVKGNRPVGTTIFMQGGVCYNRAVPLALATILGKHVVVPPEPGLMGAYGVALELKKRIRLGLVDEQDFYIQKIIERQVRYEEPFTCAGGGDGCDLKCRVNRIRIEGKLYPFGGACNRYTTIRPPRVAGTERLDYVAVMNSLMFEKYRTAAVIEAHAPTIGISTSFLANRLFPLYSTFFSRLGCPVVIPDGIVYEASDRKTTSMCFPAEISLGLFQNLLEKKPDYVFMPHVKEMFVPGGIDRKDFCASCLYIQGEPFLMRLAFQDQEVGNRILSPTISFNGGWNNGRGAFVDVARQLGFTRGRANQAFNTALAAQQKFEQDCGEVGRRLLKELEDHPDRFAIVLFGRVYNAYSAFTNKGIPQKLVSSGMRVIPFEFLPIEEEPLDPDYREYMHWESGQRMLRAARMVKRNKQLFGVFITNFLCGPDSFIVSYFRRTMGTKPSLTLELDAHTADAGINTRIEAFLDIVRNYREVQSGIRDRATGSTAAMVRPEQGKMVYVDSDGAAHSLTSPKVKMILPSMGDLGSRAFAGVCRRYGIRTEALPIADPEVLRLGRGVTTCKECIPLLLCIGSMIAYLNRRDDPDEKLLIMIPKAGGYCRLGQYHIYINQYIRDQGLRDVALITPAMEENFLGLGTRWSIWAWRVVVVTDLMDDIRNALIAIALDVDSAMSLFDREFEMVLRALERGSAEALYRQLAATARALRGVPLRMRLHEAPHVELTGEIYVRRDSFSNLGLAKRLAERGFVVSIAPNAEWLYYINHLIADKLIEPRFTLQGRLNFIISCATMRHLERKIKRILSSSSLCESDLIDIDDLMRFNRHIVTPRITGEHDLVLGTTLKESLTKYCGIVSVGPFGCMQLRFAEGITAPVANVRAKREALRQAGKEPVVPGFDDDDRIPFLNVESDGNPYPQLLEARFESFCLQAARIAERQGKRTDGLKLR